MEKTVLSRTTLYALKDGMSAEVTVEDAEVTIVKILSNNTSIRATSITEFNAIRSQLAEISKAIKEE